MLAETERPGGDRWPGATLPDVGQLTAQAGRITTEHVVIGTEPRSRWYKSPLMWMGTAFGLIVGFGLGKM